MVPNLLSKLHVETYINGDKEGFLRMFLDACLLEIKARMSKQWEISLQICYLHLQIGCFFRTQFCNLVKLWVVFDSLYSHPHDVGQVWRSSVQPPATTAGSSDVLRLSTFRNCSLFSFSNVLARQQFADCFLYFKSHGPVSNLLFEIHAWRDRPLWRHCSSLEESSPRWDCFIQKALSPSRSCTAL